MLSCVKVQAFLLALFGWLLPAFILQRLERQARAGAGARAGGALRACLVVGLGGGAAWALGRRLRAAPGCRRAHAVHQPMPPHPAYPLQPPMQMFSQFVAQRRAAQDAHADGRGDAAEQQFSSSRCPVTLAWQRWRRWQQAHLPLLAQRAHDVQQDVPGWPVNTQHWAYSWCVLLLLAGLCWHLIDTLVV